MTWKPCKREGCKRAAWVDEFCSTYCAKVVHGVIQPSKRATRRERELRKSGDMVEVVNTDAMTRTLPGSFGSGKRT